MTGLKPKEVEQKEDLELCKLMHPKLEEKRELKSSSDEESDESESRYKLAVTSLLFSPSG